MTNPYREALQIIGSSFTELDEVDQRVGIATGDLLEALTDREKIEQRYLAAIKVIGATKAHEAITPRTQVIEQIVLRINGRVESPQTTCPQCGETVDPESMVEHMGVHQQAEPKSIPEPIEDSKPERGENWVVMVWPDPEVKPEWWHEGLPDNYAPTPSERLALAAMHKMRGPGSARVLYQTATRLAEDNADLVRTPSNLNAFRTTLSDLRAKGLITPMEKLARDEETGSLVKEWIIMPPPVQ